MSSTKKTLKQYATISNGAMSGTNTITSQVTAITGLDNIGFQFDWTGSPTGTFQVQISSNYNQDENGVVLSAGTWVPITVTYWNGSTFVTATSIPTSVGTPIYVDISVISAPYIRCQYTNASGSGTLTAVVCGKSI